MFYNKMINSTLFIFLSLIIRNISYAIYLPCVNFDENCYYQPCCKPYICYEETVCIGMNNTTNLTNS
jgi:hypothetical protein